MMTMTKRTTTTQWARKEKTYMAVGVIEIEIVKPKGERQKESDRVGRNSSGTVHSPSELITRARRTPFVQLVVGLLQFRERV